MNGRWQRKVEHPSHIDDWLMTYADVITLLLCFFAVSLAVSMPKKDIPPIVPPAKIIEQSSKIVEPSWPLTGNLPFKEIPDADIVDDDKPQDPALGTASSDINSPTAPPQKNDQDAASDTGKLTAPSVDAQLTASSPAPPASLPQIVDHLKAQGAAVLQQKGDRITTLQMDSAAFFDSGSAQLSEAGKSILRAVTLNLISDKYKDYRITVEGHTDDQPIKTAQFPSNWELSTARASAVVHFFLEQGIQPQRLRAAGYADTFPIAPNRDSSGKAIPENQARNRRVVINLEKIDKDE